MRNRNRIFILSWRYFSFAVPPPLIQSKEIEFTLTSDGKCYILLKRIFLAVQVSDMPPVPEKPLEGKFSCSTSDCADTTCVLRPVYR